MNRNHYFLSAIIILGVSLVYSFCFAETKVKESSVVVEDIKKCFIEVGNLLSVEDVDEFKSAAKDEVANYHFTIGRLIRNNCGLLEDTLLSRYFIEKNIESPDDMSMVVLECYYLHLNDKEFDLDDLIKRFKGGGVNY